MADAPTDRFDIDILTPDQAGFADACGQVAGLLAEREAEFRFNPGIERPEVPLDALLVDVASALAPAIAGDGPVTILTTWSDRLAPFLGENGFHFRPIPWPAGPLNSGIFRREGEGRERYIELVNEEAPEIAPSHLVLARDARGLAGGAITILRGNAAWLAVMCVRAGMPGGTGTRIWDALVADLAVKGIERLDLGTQTAERFYRRCGMSVTDRVVPRLRWRPDAGQQVWNDLVMMTVAL